jgi:hypothetical protein
VDRGWGSDLLPPGIILERNGMTVHTLTPRHGQSIQVTAVSSREWTVVDTRVPPGDAKSLIGFIEKVDDRFEVMEFGDPLKFFTAATMNAALAQLSRARLSLVPTHAA